MTHKKFLLLVATVLMAFTAKAQGPKPDEQQVLDLSLKKFTWLVEKNYDSLNALADDRLQYIHSNGWIETKKDLIDDLKNGKLSYLKVSVKESSARLYGPTAIVNGLATFEGTTEGKTFAMDLRYTEVYVKQGRHWRLATRHSNRMP